METVQMNISGMSCAGCARSIGKKLRATAGVIFADVDLTAAVASISYEEQATNSAVLAQVGKQKDIPAHIPAPASHSSNGTTAPGDRGCSIP